MSEMKDVRTLIEQIDALLAINASGNAVPRIPGLAVELLTRSRSALDAALAARPAPEAGTVVTRDERQAAWAALRMIRDAVGELFGVVASIESEEAVLFRGPEYHHEAEATIAALQRVADVLAAHSRPSAAGGTKLVALMSEAIPALEATGCNVSLVKDLRAAVAAIPTPSANAQDVGELVLTEIKRLRPYYQTITATDAGRRQMLDHFENMLAAHKRTATDDVVA